MALRAEAGPVSCCLLSTDDHCVQPARHGPRLAHRGKREPEGESSCHLLGTVKLNVSGTQNVHAECTPHLLALLMRISSSEPIALVRADTPLLTWELRERSGKTMTGFGKGLTAPATEFINDQCSLL